MPGVIQSIYGGLTGAGTANEQTAFNRDLQEGDDAQVQGGALRDQGNGLQTQFGNEYLNQGNIQGGYRGQADTAYGDLATNPGYSATDRLAIQGNPNAGFQYYNPSELQGDTSGYAQGLNDAAQRGQQYLQAAPTNQTNWQGGINRNLEQSGTEAVGGLQSGLNTAVSGYGTNLDEAVDPSKLTVGDQLNGYELSPEEAQNIRNVAAQTTAGQYGKMSEQALLDANAQGNTSPAALAAIRENIGRQGAIDAGNAASTAELSANQAAANRQLSKTQTNLGANQTLAQLQAQNATNLEGAQSNAANQIYGAKQGTAANQAATETQANESIAANQGAAANAQANLGYNAAQTGGAQKIATDTGLQQTGQGLATGADTAASNRATTTANQTKSDQGAYRNYLTGEQGAAQTGQATAGGQQLSAYGGTTSAYGAQQGAINNANAAAGNVAVGANSSSQNLQGSFLADGGTVTGPTVGGYDDSTLPKPHMSGTPDIYHDYREQINPEGTPGGGSSNSTNLNVSVGSGGGGGGYLGGDDGGDLPYDPYNYPGADMGYTGTNTYSTMGGGGEGPINYRGGDYTGEDGGYQAGTDGGGDGYDQYSGSDYYGDGGTSSGTDATIAERGPEAVVSRPSRYAAIGREAVNGLGSLLSGGRMQRPASTPPTTPSAPQQAIPQAPQSTSSKIANTVGGILTGHRYYADGDPGQTNLMNAMSTNAQGNPNGYPSARGDGSSVPGNEPGGEQGQYGWQGPASRQMAGTQQSNARQAQQPQAQIFTQPTNVTLGGNGMTDTVVPLNPGPNAKITPSQMGMGGQPQGQQSRYASQSNMRQAQQPPQAANQPQPRMPSRYRPATGPKGMVGPQMRPMQSQQYAA